MSVLELVRSPAVPVKSALKEIKARRLLRSGLGIFGALGVVTAGWFAISGHLPLTYVLVMIPVSAIGVICIFNGWNGGHFNALGAGINEQTATSKLLLGEFSELRGDVRSIADRQKATDTEVAALIRRVTKLEQTLAVVTSPNVVELESMRTLQTIDQRLNGDHPQD